jgi:hypothetical protein
MYIIFFRSRAENFWQPQTAQLWKSTNAHAVEVGSESMRILAAPKLPITRAYIPAWQDSDASSIAALVYQRRRRSSRVNSLTPATDKPAIAPAWKLDPRTISILAFYPGLDSQRELQCSAAQPESNSAARQCRGTPMAT